jgi:hypothetical protein
MSEDNLMSRTKEASRRKRRTNAVPMLAGLSLSLASGPAPAIGGVNPDLATSAPIAQQMMDDLARHEDQAGRAERVYIRSTNRLIAATIA